MKFSIKDFLVNVSKSAETQPMWSGLLEKSLIDNVLFRALISAKN